MLEARLEEILATCFPRIRDAPSATVRQGHLALLNRWYYRPEAKRSRAKSSFLTTEDHWPIRLILRGIGRVAAKTLTGSSAS